MDLTEVEWEGLDRMYLDGARDQWQAVMNTVMKLRVPKKMWYFLTR
jgi:hypothetical protein